MARPNEPKRMSSNVAPACGCAARYRAMGLRKTIKAIPPHPQETTRNFMEDEKPQSRSGK
jgi:hypothetical protein